MSFENVFQDALDYAHISYGSKHLRFRGPQADLNKPFVAFLGGSETYGRYVPEPFPDLIKDGCGCEVLNLGHVNAGPDLYLQAPYLISILNKAELAIIQIMGAQNVTNRFYKVHPRRNDRFVAPSEVLRTLYPDVDFTDISFTGHLLDVLRRTSPDRFEVIVSELRSAWKVRMHRLLYQLSGRKYLLWISGGPASALASAPVCNPPYVDADMVKALGSDDVHILNVRMTSETLGLGTQGMVFPELEQNIASQMLPVAAHRQIAAALLPIVTDAIKKPASLRGPF